MTPQLGKAEVFFFALHFYSVKNIYLYSLKLISLVVSELQVCPIQSSK